MDANGTWELKEYEPETMLRYDSVVMMVGMRGSGKTIMMLYFLMILARQLDMAIGFMATQDTLKEFAEHVQAPFLYPEYDEEQLTKIVDAQRALTARKPRRLADGTYEVPNHRRVAIVLDDCMYEKKSGKGKTLRYLFMNGRHDNFFFMNGVQYVMDMDKSLRSQVDLVVAFPVQEDSHLKPLRENLLGCFSTDAQLSRMFASLQPNEALVFDRKLAAKKEPSLFFCKARYPLPRFRVGCDLFWLWYYKYFVRKGSSHVEALIRTRLQAALEKPVDAVRIKALAPIKRTYKTKKSKAAAAEGGAADAEKR
jgi:hypothetical protein